MTTKSKLAEHDPLSLGTGGRNCTRCGKIHLPTGYRNDKPNQCAACDKETTNQTPASSRVTKRMGYSLSDKKMIFAVWRGEIRIQLAGDDRNTHAAYFDRKEDAQAAADKFNGKTHMTTNNDKQEKNTMNTNQPLAATMKKSSPRHDEFRSVSVRRSDDQGIWLTAYDGPNKIHAYCFLSPNQAVSLANDLITNAVHEARIQGPVK